MKYEIKNRRTGNVIFTAGTECDEGASASVRLGLAVKANTNLRGANLRGANLGNADLRGANLGGANLGGADLIHCGTRSDGYGFYAHIRDGAIWIKAGCRYFPEKDAAKHWRKTRGGTQLGGESLQLLKNARALMKIRGLA